MFCCNSQTNGNEGCARHALIHQIAVVFAIVLTIFVAVKTLYAWEAYRTVGQEKVPPSTITVSGKGEVIAIPDIATVSFSVVGEAKQVADAQKQATDISNRAIAFLKDKGIAEKDIKTTNYSIYPRYEYPTRYTAQGGYSTGERVFMGYEVTQSVEVKIRAIADAGAVLGGLGSIGVTNLSGLTFLVDKEDQLKRTARSGAIADAQSEAKNLARALGVSLGKITNFSEGGNYRPMYMMKTASYDALGGAESAPAPDVPAGENKIVSEVTITYEIE
ncbi:MAG: SIMPL domain-containing protein [Patescibacteria group bacterium]